MDTAVVFACFLQAAAICTVYAAAGKRTNQQLILTIHGAHTAHAWPGNDADSNVQKRPHARIAGLLLPRVAAVTTHTHAHGTTGCMSSRRRVRPSPRPAGRPPVTTGIDQACMRQIGDHCTAAQAPGHQAGLCVRACIAPVTTAMHALAKLGLSSTF
jgi:hypothetical protein